MKIKVLLCNCKGLCASFQDANMNTLPFQIESDLDVDYALLHPQLCGEGGHEVLADVLRGADPDTVIVCGACAADTQERLFKRVLRTVGFPPERFVAVDVRGADNAEIVRRLRERVEALNPPTHAHPLPVVPA